MNFRISDTFTDSLAKLTGDEQKAAKITALDLQLDPANPGMQFHRVDGAKDAHFWTVRVNRDIRIVVHKTGASLMLCYVDHHDDAYAWAERRKIERHPKTGAMQLVEVQEKVVEIPVYQQVAEAPLPHLPFIDVPRDDLLSYGVPADWIGRVRETTEDGLFTIAEHLPQEAAEALLELATGGTPTVSPAIPEIADPFEHPDAQRRFRVMTNKEELEQALEFPWNKWTVFLHPAQREMVTRDTNGPSRISGSAGTGKTVVALHRAVHLAREYRDARVLLATFSDTLARSLEELLRRLIHHEPKLRERIDVHALDSLALRLHESRLGQPSLISDAEVARLLQQAIEATGCERFSQKFLWSEWSTVIDAWQLRTWESYREVARRGRRTRVSVGQREELWAIFAWVREQMEARGVMTMEDVYGRLAEHFAEVEHRPFDYAVIDEAQDIGVGQLRFLATLLGDRPNSLTFTGDLGQRIFQPPFSWKELGVDVRGRSSTLRINYRTSHQIRRHADRLLDPETRDMDGNIDDRSNTISVFNGPAPSIQLFDDEANEIAAVAEWLKARVADGTKPGELAIFVRSAAEVDRARQAADGAELAWNELDASLRLDDEKVCIGTMHLAKGLEFKCVAVMACDDDVIPADTRMAAVTEDMDMSDAYDAERRLLYVACTRARDQLLLTALEPGSEFLEDLGGN